MYKLRDYQSRVKSELYDWLSKHPKGFPIVDACVGAGKSVIIADLCRDMINHAPDTRIVMCVATKELCEQNMHKLLSIWSDAPAGLCSASLGQKDTDSQIIFATIGTLARRVQDLGCVDVMIIDECHNVNTDNAGMYRKMIETLQDTTSPSLCVIGFTGTPFRGNGIWLWQGKDPIFEGVASRVSMDELLKLGYLSPLVVDKGIEKIDTSHVSITAGDYNNAELAVVLENESLMKSIIDDVYIRANDRQKWLIFCHSIAQAEMVLKQVQGFRRAEMVIGDTPSLHRQMYLAAFKKPFDDPDAINILVNVGVLTTGFDAPMIDCLVLLRPTKSPVLYVQIAGRGMRVADGKKDCLWLDYTSTTRELGPVNHVRGRNKSDRITGTTATGEKCKYCPECGEKLPIYASECYSCGASLVSNKNQQFADTAEVLDDGTPKWFDVCAISYQRHLSKNSGLASMRVSYHVDFQEYPISEYVCIEHSGFARSNAQQWWKKHHIHDMPATVDEGLELVHYASFPKPKRIECKRDGKFYKVINREIDRDNPPPVWSQPPKMVNDDMPF